MNLDKIGRFIALNRKNKGLTQEQLAEKLGVTNKTVSRWETGKYMPDLSLLKPLSEELGITLNELLSGENVDKEKIVENAELSIIKALDYSSKKVENEHRKISIIMMVMGAIICVSALTIFDKESSWCCIYSILGIILFVIGLVRMLNMFNKIQRILGGIVLFISIFGLFYVVDYLGVMLNNRPPIYNYRIETTFRETKEIAYYSLFYNVYRMNVDTMNEYYIIDKKKEYNFDTMELTPFNRNKSGIDNIIKYKNKYIGNNSNVGNLLYNLPLSEYGFVFEIDSNNFGIIVDYNTTDWYVNNNLYIERSMIYNSISIFLLIDNVEYIKYNFSGSSYVVTRNNIGKYYPNYLKVKDEDIDKDKFNKYVEQKLNDNDFVEKEFDLLFGRN